MMTLKRMFILQRMKIDVLWDTVDSYTDIFRHYINDMPDSMKQEIINVSEKLLYLNDRIDKAREKNISMYFNSLRDKYEGIFNMEVQDERKEE